MLTKDDLFTSVSPTAIEAKQDNVPKPEKRAYKKSLTKKRTVTQVDRYKINKLLEEHLTPKDDKGIVSFLHDMDDHKIAALIGPHVSYDTVRNQRQEVFGILRKFVPLSKNRDGQNHDELMEKIRLLLLEHHERLFKLEKLFNKFAEEIGFRV